MGNLRIASVSLAAVLASAIGAATLTTNASAADLPPIVDIPPEVIPQGYGGWYLRGDIGYAKASITGVSYFQGPTMTGEFEQYDIDHAWMFGGGIGYQINDWFRVDLTGNYYASANFNGSSAQDVTCTNRISSPPGNCSYSENGSVQTTTLLANAYVDLGTWQGLTPYVGAGIGGAYHHWELSNTEYDIADPDNSFTDVHEKRSGWRFAYGLHAGVSYDLSQQWKIDAGYSFTHITGGEMFGFCTVCSEVGTQGYNGDMKIHAFRVGLRYMLY